MDILFSFSTSLNWPGTSSALPPALSDFRQGSPPPCPSVSSPVKKQSDWKSSQSFHSAHILWYSLVWYPTPIHFLSPCYVQALCWVFSHICTHLSSFPPVTVEKTVFSPITSQLCLHCGFHTLFPSQGPILLSTSFLTRDFNFSFSARLFLLTF